MAGKSSDRAAHPLAGPRSGLYRRPLALAVCASWIVSPEMSFAASNAPPSAADLKKLSIEELMDIEVSSVSRTMQRLGGAPAAIAVVTNEQIRRSGATSIAETLRGVPGLYVAQKTSSVWAISSRGFTSTSSEKLLVLTDTRSVYTPLYSGVFWDVQDYLLQDIERIEVIRGPGAALWGSNAVNGVINIITKNARDTQDLYLEAGSGGEQETFAAARYGGTLGERGFFRVFGKYSSRDGTYHPDAQSDDDWHLANFGFRSDWDLNADDALTVQGGYYQGDVGQVAPSIIIGGRPRIEGELEASIRGGNLLTRWVRSISADSQLRVRFYYDQTHRDDPAFLDDLDTLDLDVQHGFNLAGRHRILWGLNYRYTDNRNEGKGLFALNPADSQDTVISAFVQDRMALTRSLELTVGTKFEENEFSDFEIQPNLRLAWAISAQHSAWAAVSRAVRVPTRLERDLIVDASDPAGNPVVRLLGTDEFDSEELLAYEAGYRWRPAESFFIDVATFYNRYEGLASLELGAPFADPTDGRTIVPVLNRNLTDGDSHGLEALISYSPVPRWRLTATYSYIDVDLEPRGDDINRGEFYEGATPRHQFGLRSFLDLPNGVQLDVHLRDLDDVRRAPEIATGEGIEGYTELDVRLAWQAWQELEVSLVGHNLLHDRHVEWGAPDARGAIERTVYAKVAWGF